MGDATTSGRRAQALVSASTAAEPRWTPETRPVVDGAKPASERAAPSASLLPRSIVMEQAPCVGVFGAEEGISRYPLDGDRGLPAPKSDESYQRCSVIARSSHCGAGCASSVAHSLACAREGRTTRS